MTRFIFACSLLTIVANGLSFYYLRRASAARKRTQIALDEIARLRKWR